MAPATAAAARTTVEAAVVDGLDMVRLGSSDWYRS
jgi:hypothetical protein